MMLIFYIDTKTHLKNKICKTKETTQIMLFHLSLIIGLFTIIFELTSGSELLDVHFGILCISKIETTHAGTIS